jgi:hypothetical protein
MSQLRRTVLEAADTEAVTFRLPRELVAWIRETSFTARKSQVLIVEEALTRYRESG